MNDTVVSVCLLILIGSIVFFVYQRSYDVARQKCTCAPCLPCTGLCKEKSRQAIRVVSPHLDMFDKLQGKCSSAAGPLRRQRRLDLKSLDACAGTCANDSACMGFDHQNDSCWLISANDNQDKLSSVFGSNRGGAGQCYRKRLPRADQHVDPATFTLVGRGECLHTHSSGDKRAPTAQKNSQAKSFLECSNQCKNDGGCSSFSFNSLLNTCLINAGTQATSGADAVNDSTACFSRKNARPSFPGYTSEPGECIGAGIKAARIQSEGRTDADTERKCFRLCNEDDECIGFTFDKRRGKGCQLISGRDNPRARVYGLKGSKLQREAFSCFIKDRARPDAPSELDRITRILRNPNFRTHGSNEKGTLVVVDSGQAKHLASTYCEPGDTCVDQTDPSLGCAQYDKDVHFDTTIEKDLAKNKLCFRGLYREKVDGVSKNQQSFRRQLDFDKLGPNPVLLGQTYTSSPGRATGQVVGQYSSVDKAVVECNGDVKCTHLAITSPFDITAYSNAQMIPPRADDGVFRLKRDGFATPRPGSFPCNPAHAFGSASEAEPFCKSSSICRGYNDKGETFTCKFKDRAIVLAKQEQ